MSLGLFSFTYYLIVVSLIDAILTPLGIVYLDQEELSGYSEKVMIKYGYIGWVLLRIALTAPIVFIAFLITQLFGEALIYSVFIYPVLAVFGLIALIDVLVVGMELWERL